MADQTSSIKRKLMTVILLISSTVLLLTSAGFLAYEIVSYRKHVSENLATLGKIVAANTTAMLAFDDAKEATEVLYGLQAEGNIVAAALYKEDQLFAQFPTNQPPGLFPSRPGQFGTRVEEEFLVHWQPVMQAGTQLGWLYLKSDLADLAERFRLYFGMVLMMMIGSFLIAVVLSTALQKRISRPILALAQTARIISRQKDYSVRAEKFTRDEIGELTDAFNHMLAQIQERDQAIRASEERYRSLVAAMTSFVWTTNAAGEFESPQPAWQAYTGQTWPEHKGLSWLDALHPDDREPIKTRWMQSLTNRAVYDAEGRLWHAASEQYRHFVARAVPMLNADGSVREWIGTITDIHDRKTAEEEILRLNTELEKRVEERTAQLAMTNQELESFTYSVSHDLRAPLRHIDAFSQILIQEHAKELRDDARNYLQRIRRGIQHMGRLVDDLLNLARVGRQDLNRQLTPLNTIVQEVLADFRSETENRQVEWRIGPLPSVECDPGLINVVFANLFSNALKYTRPRAKAVIEVGQIAGGPETTIFVRDNGVGFSMKYAHKLFGVFQRLHRLDEFEGTGVGLATVERIIRKHGGRVWAEGEVDQGATFYFTLGNSEKRSSSFAPGKLISK
ncbi:MAG: ATP-binding protein [Verrucomicrobiota bacterium]